MFRVLCLLTGTPLAVFKDEKSLLSENTNSLKGKLFTERDLFQESLFIWSRMELDQAEHSQDSW